MKCYICDSQLNESEIKYDKHSDKHKFEPCGVCLEVIDNVFEDPVPEEQQRSEESA